MTKSVFIFNDKLFTDAMKENLSENILNSNIIKNKLLSEINKINFNLKKEGSHEFILSLTTMFEGKTIHIEESGSKFYDLVKSIVDKFEKILRRSKIK